MDDINKFKKNNYRIYSRYRVDLFTGRNRKNNKRSFSSNKIKGLLGIYVLIGILGLVMFKSFNPIFETICKDSAVAAATKITNDQTSKAMENYAYEDLFKVEKDNER